MITDFYNKKVDTKRLSDITGTLKEEYTLYLTDVNCLIEPYSDGFTEDIDGSVGKDYVMFCEVADIKEGDKIVDGTDEYKVVGLKKYIDRNSEHHLELIIRQYKK